MINLIIVTVSQLIVIRCDLESHFESSRRTMLVREERGDAVLPWSIRNVGHFEIENTTTVGSIEGANIHKKS